MIRSKSGLRVLGICAVALGLMAFSASAQAATWMVKTANLTSGSKKVVAKIVGTSASLLTTLAGVKVKFLCTGAALTNASLESGGKVSAGGKVRFSGCVTYLNEKLSPPCEPLVGAEKGIVQTNEGKGQLGQHTSGEGVTVIEALAGGLTGKLGTVQMGEECSIGEEVPIFGKLAIVDSGGMTGLLTETKLHAIKEEASLTHLYAISDTAEHKAIIDGEASVELESGEVWNGLVP